MFRSVFFVQAILFIWNQEFFPPFPFMFLKIDYSLQ